MWILSEEKIIYSQFDFKSFMDKGSHGQHISEAFRRAEESRPSWQTAKCEQTQAHEPPMHTQLQMAMATCKVDTRRAV